MNHYDRCKCCLEGGRLRDMWREYISGNGEREIYGEMITKCFALSWQEPSYKEQICELCVGRLRNSFIFKKQVLETEQLLLEQFEEEEASEQTKTESVHEVIQEDIHEDLAKENILQTITVNDPPALEIISNVPEHEITQQKYIGEEFMDIDFLNDDNNSDSVLLILQNDTDNEDYVNNFDSEIDIVENKNLVIEHDAEVPTNKPIMKEEPVTPGVKRMLFVKCTEKPKHHENLRAMLLCTNATPIRRRTDRGYMCGFCNKHYLHPYNLKIHTIEEHNDDTKAKYLNERELGAFNPKLDITDLICNICTKPIPNLEDMLEHLKIKHNQTTYMDINNQIIPIKLESDSDVFTCFMCNAEFKFFTLLIKHTTTHYPNFECKPCDMFFMNAGSYRYHLRNHSSGDFPCVYCAKVYTSRSKRTAHEFQIHKSHKMRFICGFCKKRFKSDLRKRQHLELAHGVGLTTFKCQSCDKRFNDIKGLKRHTERIHLKAKNHYCSECGKGYHQKSNLKKHILTHIRKDR